MIARLFPERDFTIMDTPNGNVYSYHQSSFWRFTKFCGTISLVIWASWSTYIFTYHRPLLQKRTQELEQEKEIHARQLSDLLVYLKKYNDLARDLNIIDYKVLDSKKISESQKDSLIKRRLNTWSELDFLQTRLNTMFSDEKYIPEFRTLSDLSVQYDLVKSENDELKKQNKEMNENMVLVSDADNQIVKVVSKLTNDKTSELQRNLKRINGTIANLGLNQNVLVERANSFSSQMVGSSFIPLDFDEKMDPKYQKLADNLALWHGLSRLDTILPLGAPVDKVHITSTFGMRTDPFNGEQKKHKGLDFAGKIGTELFAVAPGRVVSAGERVGYGKTVEVDHGLGFTTLYAHLSRIYVTRGDWVRPGTVVGLAGSSGRSTGPHLHYEIRYNGAPFNPEKFVKE
ncbi:MAG TPA: peptidoglycan DD-metalloendopeptidase family protein [Alphaproteobacteria bacterium]|nr:peptidoglycan DD-metalloendopeptidase family protein [Alphaproteobacteria bacterium]